MTEFQFRPQVSTPSLRWPNAHLMGSNALLSQVSHYLNDILDDTNASSKWRAWTATLATIALASSFAIAEMILILTLRVSVSSSLHKNCR